MSVRRIAVLLHKELMCGGSHRFFMIFAIVTPVVFTLFVKLVFGSFFEGKPKLGIIDFGNSKIVSSLKKSESVDLTEYLSEMEMKAAVETGLKDVGVVLQDNFDSMIAKGELTKLTAYVWGESLLKNRAVVGAVMIHQMRNIAGKKAALDITPIPLGDEKSVSWEDRLLPLIVLIAVFMGGFAVPATSLVDEKEKGTIGAVLTTPVTQCEIFVSKGSLGVIVSMIMGIVILILNHALSAQAGLMLLVLLLGAIMAACIGLILGAFMKDAQSLFSAHTDIPVHFPTKWQIDE